VQQVWARALAAGVDDLVFWGSTPAEAAMLFTEVAERELAIWRETQRAANLRAGVIAATIVNMAGKVSKRTAKASEFFIDPRAERDSPEALRNALIMWGESTKGVRLA
jgi:hypothetical protein